MTAKSTATLLGLALALSACKGEQPPAPAPSSRPATDAVRPPPVEPDPPRSQQAAAASDLEKAITDAAACVKGGRVDRRCVPFRTLREGTRGHRDDEAWQQGLRSLIDQPTDHGLLALELMADGLVSIGDPAAIAPRLLSMLDNPKANEHHREHALRSLNRVDHPTVIPRALKVLTDDPAPRVRASAAYLMAKPAHKASREQTTPALIAALNKDTASAVRRATLQALGLIKAPAALPVLIKYVDDPMVGPNATMAVAGYKDAAAWKAIYSRISKMATDPAAPARPALLASLVRLQGHPNYDAKALEATLEALVKALEGRAESDANAGTARVLATRNLKRIRDARAAAAPAPAPK